MRALTAAGQPVAGVNAFDRTETASINPLPARQSLKPVAPIPFSSGSTKAGPWLARSEELLAQAASTAQPGALLVQARAYAAAACAHEPGNAKAWLQYGLVCYALAAASQWLVETDSGLQPIPAACQAEHCFERAWHLNASLWQAPFNLGSIAFNCENYALAQQQYERAESLLDRQACDDKTLRAELQLCMAKSLKEQRSRRSLQCAGDYYQRAVALAPDDQRIRWEYALYLLALTPDLKAWQAYESRLQAFDWQRSGLRMYPFARLPQWQGSASVQSVATADRVAEGTLKLLVQAEQGLGDEIMFSRFLCGLPAGINASFACSPSLCSLFARSLPCEVVAHERSETRAAGWSASPPLARLAEQANAHCPLLSLPARLGSETLPQVTGWLQPDPQRVARWGNILGLQEHKAKRTRSAGQVTVGSPDATNAAVGTTNALATISATISAQNDLQAAKRRPLMIGLLGTANLATGAMGRRKSIVRHELSMLSANASQRWISLQKQQPGCEADNRFAPLGEDFSQYLQDFDDTAALIAHLDLVISVDTAVAHLAGAMGKPVFLLLPRQCDWRWGMAGDTSAWYPGMRLFRQSIAGQWLPVLEQVAAALADIEAGRNAEQ